SLRRLKGHLVWGPPAKPRGGSVYHKASTRGFGPAILPEEEKTERFFAPWSSAATADFVAMMATAARVYRPFDQDYSRRCLEAARRSYAFLASHSENHPADLTGFTTGAYPTADGDDRLWAAAEMWETAGEADALRDFETRVRAAPKKFEANWGWGNVTCLGLLTYLFSSRAGRDGALPGQIKDNLLAAADEVLRI